MSAGSEGTVRRMHVASEVTLLVLGLGAVTASMVLSTDGHQVFLGHWSLPPMCAFRELTGWPCPGCGLTRSFVYMGHLQVLEAFRMHLLGPVAFIVAAAQVPLRLRTLWRLRRG